MTEDQLYEQLCKNYRFFLKWRQAVFGGYLVILGATLSLSIAAYKDARPITWIVPVSASPLGLVFWGLDIRVRKLFRHTYLIGRRMEGDYYGFFNGIGEIGVVPKADPMPWLTNSLILTSVYIGSAVILTLLGATSWWEWH
jgi:hypothetical protein